MSQRVAAPLWRRSVAALIDGLLVVLPSVPTLIRARKGPRRSPRSLDVLSTVLNAAYQVSAIASTGQTLGQRALGIRVVGQDTGGVPSMSQALVRWTLTAIPDGLSLLTSRPLAPRARQAEAAMGDLAAEVKELRRNHGTDRQGLNEALMALYKDRNANPIHDACRRSWPPFPECCVGALFTRRRFGDRCIRGFMTAWRGPSSSCSNAGDPDRIGCPTVDRGWRTGQASRQPSGWPSGHSVCQRNPWKPQTSQVLPGTSLNPVDRVVRRMRLRAGCTAAGNVWMGSSPGVSTGCSLMKAMVRRNGRVGAHGSRNPKPLETARPFVTESAQP
jgi:uncharacterized RDD family membrane protein YckC